MNYEQMARGIMKSGYETWRKGEFSFILSEISKDWGVKESEVEAVARSLDERGWMKILDFAFQMKITPEGISEYETRYKDAL